MISVAAGQTVNYEATTNGQVAITVGATDGSLTTQNAALIINVTDVNEAPTLAATATVHLSETAPSNALVTDIDAGDPDTSASFGTASHRYSILTGTGSSYFSIDPLTGVVRTATSGAPFDYDAGVRSYVLTVRVIDNSGTGLSADQALTVTIDPVQENPTNPGAFSGSINENATGVVANIGGSTDPEGEAITYDFAAGGNPGGLFSVTPGGQLSLNTAIDYENRLAAFSAGYADVQIVAKTASGGVSEITTGRITLLNVNEAPTTPSAPPTGSITENTTGLVGITFSGATDPEGDAIVYRFAGGATTSGNFSIINGNQLNVVTAFNYEAQTSASVVVYAYANGQQSAAGVTATVNIGNLDDNVPVGSGIAMQNGYTTTIAENSAVGGTVIAKANASDPDGDALTYSLTANPGGAFGVDASGNIFVNSGIDYEALGGTSALGVQAPINITLTVRTAQSNNSGRFVDQSLTLSITDVAELQPIFDLSVDYVNSSNGPNTTFVTQYQETVPGGYVYYYYKNIGGFQTGTPYYERLIAKDNNGNGIYDSAVDTKLYDYYTSGGTPMIDFTAVGYHWEGGPGYDPNSWHGVTGLFVKELPPVVLDLDGSGIRQSSITTEFDVDGDGEQDLVGWISGGQAFLALDRNGNGTIDGGSEISFMADLAGANTDLEGLRAYDSNGDGVLDEQDARFGEFLVWQDADEDGVSDAGELRTWPTPESPASTWPSPRRRRRTMAARPSLDCRASRARTAPRARSAMWHSAGIISSMRRSTALNRLPIRHSRTMPCSPSTSTATASSTPAARRLRSARRCRSIPTATAGSRPPTRAISTSACGPIRTATAAPSCSSCAGSTPRASFRSNCRAKLRQSNRRWSRRLAEARIRPCRRRRPIRRPRPRRPAMFRISRTSASAG